MSTVERRHRELAAKVLRMDWLETNDPWLVHGVYGPRETTIHQAELVALEFAAAEKRGAAMGLEHAYKIACEAALDCDERGCPDEADAIRDGVCDELWQLGARGGVEDYSVAQHNRSACKGAT